MEPTRPSPALIPTPDIPRSAQERWNWQITLLTEARVVIEDYRRNYNHHRPHSKLGYQSPKRFAATQSAPSPAPVALRAPYAGDGQNQTHNVSNNKVSD